MMYNIIIYTTNNIERRRVDRTKIPLLYTNDVGGIYFIDSTKNDDELKLLRVFEREIPRNILCLIYMRSHHAKPGIEKSSMYIRKGKNWDIEIQSQSILKSKRLK